MADTSGATATATPPAIPSLSDALSGYQGRLTGHADDVKARLDDAKSIFDIKSAKADTEEAALNPNALVPPTLTPPPTPKATQPVEVWGSAAMAIAALGGILTRRPLTNALNAMGSVLNAYRQMDGAAAQRAYDTWKTETDNAVKMAQFTLDSYKASLSRVQDDRKGAQADFLATARALGDENAAYVAEHYGMDAVLRYVDAMQRHVDTVDKSKPTIDAQNTRLQLYTKVHDARVALADAQKSGDQGKISQANNALKSALQDIQDFNGSQGRGSGASGGAAAFTPEAIDEMVDQYMAGDKSVLGGLGYGSSGAAARAAFRNLLAEKMHAGGVSASDLASRLATFDTTAKSFAVRAQGNAVRSFGVLISHFDTLKKLYAALQNGDVRGFNTLKNTFEKEFGYAAPTNVEAARHIIGDEIIKAVTGSAGALGDRDTAQQTISGASTPEQILGTANERGLLDTYSDLALGQLRGLRTQYQAGTGLGDFDKLLSPEAKTLLNGKGMGGNSATTGVTDAEVGAAPVVNTQADFDTLAKKGHGILYRESDGHGGFTLQRTP